MSARDLVRFVSPDYLKGLTLPSDSLLTSIVITPGTGDFAGYAPMEKAAEELASALADPSLDVRQVWICGATSPLGLWGDNFKKAAALTQSATAFFKRRTGLDDSLIRNYNLDEDWRHLYYLVEQSDMPHRDEVLDVMKNLSWGERKRALQNLNQGRAWSRLTLEYFPGLYAVRVAVLCVPTAVEAAPAVEVIPSVEATPGVEAAPAVETAPVVVAAPDYVTSPSAGTTTAVAAVPAVEVAKTSEEHIDSQVPASPAWKLGIATNLLADGYALPNLGLEFRMGRKLSLAVNGLWTKWNILWPDPNTLIYGGQAELRFWPAESMCQGHFVGVGSDVLWFTTKWSNGHLYQNLSNSQPAWSASAVYGYSVDLDRKAHWGLVFSLGVGYGQYYCEEAVWNESRGEWMSVFPSRDDPARLRRHDYWGLTKLSLSITYRIHFKKNK